MEHTVEIEKIIAGGKGLGRLENGKVFMVDGVLAGERCVIVEERQRKGYVEGRLVKLLSPAATRVTPPCPYYADCGGCSLQHAGYGEQLAIKRGILVEALRRARLDFSSKDVAETLPCSDELFYRYRIRLHLDHGGRLGYHRAASNTLVPITQCLLATDVLNGAVQALVQSRAPAGLADTCKAVELIHCPATGALTLILHPHRHSAITQKSVELLFRAIQDSSPQVFSRNRRQLLPLDDTREPAAVSQQFVVANHQYRLEWSPDCFFQVNARQNLRLVALVLELLGAVQGQEVLDLFCGMGTFSIPLVLAGAKVTGIEHNSVSVDWARHNGLQAVSGDCTFLCSDVDRQLRRLIQTDRCFDHILLDPPRQGLPRSIELLPRLQPKKILYISCDPVTLARDLALLADCGYRPSAIVPVDMFPQTHHLESVTLLERN